MTTRDTTLPIWAIDALTRHAPRAEPSPLDKRRLLNSLQRLDYDMRLRHYPAVIESEQPRGDSDHVEPPDAEQTFWAQQCPADSNFR